MCYICHCNFKKITKLKKNNVKAVHYGTTTLTFFGTKVYKIGPDDTQKKSFRMNIRPWNP